MKVVGETGHTAYKFRLFGWHIIIANCPMKFKQTTCGHQSVNYAKLMSERRHIAESRCERCGRELSSFGRLYHILPNGDPDRNEIGNLRFICNSCYKAVVRRGAPLEINNSEEGGDK